MIKYFIKVLIFNVIKKTFKKIKFFKVGSVAGHGNHSPLGAGAGGKILPLIRSRSGSRSFKERLVKPALARFHAYKTH